jgi:glutaredoxin
LIDTVIDHHPGCRQVLTELTLLNRYACHLCEDMQLSLQDYATELQFSVTLVDIDDNPGLLQVYNEAVPVLMHNGREICRHFLDLQALREALAAA